MWEMKRASTHSALDADREFRGKTCQLPTSPHKKRGEIWGTRLGGRIRVRNF
jgi:hypothetical protein